MKNRIKFLGLVVVVLTIVISCSKDDNVVTSGSKDDNIVNFIDKNYSIKSTFANGKISEKYIYNENGKIIESQSFYFYEKLTYDDNDRLVKREAAVDRNSSINDKSELMTSQNTTFTEYFIFEYSGAGKLITQKNYFKKNDKFEYTSMISFEYEGDKIVKWNSYYPNNVIDQYHTFEYDRNGNVTKDKYYYFLYTLGAEPKLLLVSEESFKYDDKNNPYIIYKDLGRPGLFSNTNNIIETNSVLYIDDPIVGELSTSKTTYEYNDKGFPIKVNGVLEYKYE
jgi:hypothetical protein